MSLAHLGPLDFRVLPLYLQECISLAPCRIQDALTASHAVKFDCYLFGSCPFKSVQLVACVVGCTRKEDRCYYLLDDGTACIEACVPSRLGAPDFWPGDAVRLEGKLGNGWQNERKVDVARISLVDDDDAESMHLVGVQALWKNRYLVPFSIKEAMDKWNARPAPDLSLSISTSRVSLATPRTNRFASVAPSSPPSSASLSSEPATPSSRKYRPSTLMRSSSFTQLDLSIPFTESSYLDTSGNLTLGGTAKVGLAKPSTLDRSRRTPETFKLYLAAFFGRHGQDVYSARLVLKNAALHWLAYKVVARQLLLKSQDKTVRMPDCYVSKHAAKATAPRKSRSPRAAPGNTAAPKEGKPASPRPDKATREQVETLVKTQLRALLKDGILARGLPPGASPTDKAHYYQAFRSDLLDAPLLAVLVRLGASRKSKNATVAFKTIAHELREGGEGVESDRWFYVRDDAVEEALRRLASDPACPVMRIEDGLRGKYVYCE